MKSIRILLVTSLAGLLFSVAPVFAQHNHGSHDAAPAGLTVAQKQFLAGYESIRAALAADDLAAAKAAAANLREAPTAASIAKADSLNTARMGFMKLSNQAAMLVKGQAGYYVFNCPMVGSDWVQTTIKISNPYLGAKMSTCGEIKN